MAEKATDVVYKPADASDFLDGPEVSYAKAGDPAFAKSDEAMRDAPAVKFPKRASKPDSED